MAYSILAENRSAEELEQLDIKLGMREDPEEVALAMLRADQERRGVAGD